MISFFRHTSGKVYVVAHTQLFDKETIEKLTWLFQASPEQKTVITGKHIGPRREMITPWSTNAVEITQNMGIQGIIRIEEFAPQDALKSHDPMLEYCYDELNETIFEINTVPESVIYIDNIKEYNAQEGLALNDSEIEYLESLSKKLNRKLTDSEVFGFSQVNSEHCRHKIFNGTFIIDDVEMPESLFQMIKKTSKEHPNYIVSAYKDNVAFVQGPVIEQFAPKRQDIPAYFETKQIESVISIKAETHNFPTTVEPFNGAATGAGGEIRDRLAGGKASVPMAGTAVYMTSYSRLTEDRPWEKAYDARKWLYQTPMDILIKASNGASDFGNKFGQPLICGSVYTFEHQENDKKYGFDKVIMLAGGIGYGRKQDSIKSEPATGEKIIVMGGENYRIGMGGSAVSSVDTGQFANAIELNAIQRSNPEMQKRVANAIRALAEADENPIVLIHDHGAGGHLNCLSELVEPKGGTIDLHALPVGDPTLSAKEIVGNESQERMGLVMKDRDIHTLKAISDRERAPMYVVGEITGKGNFTFEDKKTGQNPIDLKLEDMFGNPPKTIMKDSSVNATYKPIQYKEDKIETYIENVLQLEAVACKDWLTNKVDRSVTGKVACQQTVGELQLPLSNLGAVSLDFRGKSGIATSIGHASASALIAPDQGSRLAIAEALTNIIWAPFSDGLKSVSLSANWMWPCKNKGEDARLYKAVKATSEFALALGINIPTGKDSLSMTQKYGKDDVVYSPGTVIISAAGEVNNVRKIVTPNAKHVTDNALIYIDLSSSPRVLGGSAFAQTINLLGNEAPDVKNAAYFANVFATIQKMIPKDLLLAGHDVSAGGLITALLEMVFPTNNLGLSLDLNDLSENEDLITLLFNENPAIVIQTDQKDTCLSLLNEAGIKATYIGSALPQRSCSIKYNYENYSFDINKLRDVWYKTSYLLDAKQTKPELAKQRFDNYKKQPLRYTLPSTFTGKLDTLGISPDRKASGVKAAIIREKGVNGDREMAYSMYLAGFDVKDVHMTDLIEGRETLEDVQFIVFVGGFSNSDVLGSAKGWAGAFLYNEKARKALDNFYARKDTLSLGVCNGCQLMVELGLIYPELNEKPKMEHNNSGKFESGFITVDIPQNDSVMLGSLSGSRLGIWIAHGEGQFQLKLDESQYHIPLKYSYADYPANPNGSDYNVAGISSKDGRHLAMMPHLERAIFPWQCAYYPTPNRHDDVTPWIQAFMNAKNWIENINHSK